MVAVSRTVPPHGSVYHRRILNPNPLSPCCCSVRGAGIRGLWWVGLDEEECEWLESEAIIAQLRLLRLRITSI
ncbi:hypothetical protein CEXT_693541 [Caerostris extrusa]|uniref:Uncharacterized protein n=1 Tax=Caerostris extrusa TaxID=172846 RepID=A0AAV4N0A7_CAEEX|nr:hypothetical protein CEXT_693541 [Caerostris extrusa]